QLDAHLLAYTTLFRSDDVYTVDLSRALEVLSEPRTGGRGSQLIYDFGRDADGKKVAIYEGKYGKYIKYGTRNIGLPEELRESAADRKSTRLNSSHVKI